MKEEASISLGVGGIIYLNTFAMRAFFLGIKNVTLLFDKTKRSLAIKPEKEEQPDAYRLNFSSPQRESTGMVTARSPLKALKLDRVARKNLPAFWNEKEGLLEVKL